MLVKVDLKGAYRMVPLHPQDRHLFGITWEDQVYADQALPFGLCSAPKIFTAVADAVGWALLESGIPYHIHYLDDFLFFIPTAQEGEVNLPRILRWRVTKLMIFMTLASSYTFLAIGMCADGVSVCS